MDPKHRRLSQDEIASVVGLSKAMIAKLEERALLKLRCEFRRRKIELADLLSPPKQRLMLEIERL